MRSSDILLWASRHAAMRFSDITDEEEPLDVMNDTEWSEGKNK
jgi:hypothetical protein